MSAAAMEKQRDFAPDLIRAAAAVLVLAVHFYLNNGFYQLPVNNWGMCLSTLLRMAFMTCVPLFMMLTGYLCCGQRWSVRYYRKLLPVLLVYVLSSAACLAFRVFWMKEPISLVSGLCRVLDFTAAPYAWYVEMYIGLFLLLPFFSAAWNALEDRGKLALMLTLVGMTGLPTVSNALLKLLPDWWPGIYPFAYCAIGAWLREHPIRLNRGWLWLGWLGIAAAYAAAQVILFPGEVFFGCTLNYWSGLGVFGETVCLFSLLLRCDGSRWPKLLRQCVSRIARLSLPLYLLSNITDCLIYPRLIAYIPDGTLRQLALPLMVLLSLVCSGAMAIVVDWLSRRLLGFIPKRRAAAAIDE